MKIHFFILDRPPQSFHKKIVTPSTPAIHAECASAVLDHLDELFSCELIFLVGVDDLWCTVAAKGHLQDIDNMAGLRGDSDLGRQHLPAGPVNRSREIKKTFSHPDAGGIRCPYLVGPVDRHFP